MLGAIIGDMVGSPYEFHPWQGAAEAFPLFSPRSRFTDDTVMTVAVARGLMQAYGQEQDCREAHARIWPCLQPGRLRTAFFPLDRHRLS